MLLAQVTCFVCECSLHRTLCTAWSAPRQEQATCTQVRNPIVTIHLATHRIALPFGYIGG
jgi:hypothetical protein